MAADGGRQAAPCLKSLWCEPAQLKFPVHVDLKKRLESVAASEGRSVAQIWEAFLQQV